jgi:hypothetical protein
VAGRVVRDASVGVVTAEGDVTAYEFDVLARIEDRYVAALVALFERIPQILARREIPPRVVEAPACVDESYAVVAGAVGIVAFQREDVLLGVVLLLAPEVGVRVELVRRINVEFAFVRTGKRHDLVAHLQYDVVVLRVVLRCIEGCAGCVSPSCGLVRKSDLRGVELRKVGKHLACRAHVGDDLVVVLQYVRRTRGVDFGGGSRVEDDRNAAVGVVAVVGDHPEHRETAEEIGGAYGLAFVSLIQFHVGDHLDDVVGLGDILVHHLPNTRDVVVVGRRHAEFADFIDRRTGAADQYVVAGAFEPHMAAAADLLAPIGRDEVVKGVDSLVYILFGLPSGVFAVRLPVEEIGTTRKAESAYGQTEAEYGFFHGRSC